MFSEAAVPCEAAKPESLNQNPHTALYIPISPHISPNSGNRSEIKKSSFFCERNNFFHKADVIVT